MYILWSRVRACGETRKNRNAGFAAETAQKDADAARPDGVGPDVLVNTLGIKIITCLSENPRGVRLSAGVAHTKPAKCKNHAPSTNYSQLTLREVGAK